jgi:AcrR family transcriptional regulator
MNYQEFIANANISTDRLCREIYRANRDKIQIKKEATVVRNLNRIFEATLKLSNEKGFQAMTMRDFSRETGLSLGALYAYFASKDELLAMILAPGARTGGPRARRAPAGRPRTRSTGWKPPSACIST